MTPLRCVTRSVSTRQSQSLIVWTLASLVASTDAFALAPPCRTTRRLASAADTHDATAVAVEAGDKEAESKTWLTSGILSSSFSDGIVGNAEAANFLKASLCKRVWRERQRTAQDAVSTSAVTSPCCGPDPVALADLESADEAIRALESADDEATVDGLLSEVRDAILRVVYVPTALYALRKDSQNTPGKQRQRARADGKKRRNDIVRLLADQTGLGVAAVTLDFDDGSIKQPESVDVEQAGEELFPKSGKDALLTWKPHLVYVQGGNTFWLYHCMEKGDWMDNLWNACTGPDAAVYCGVSAGAIVAGASMETACWKAWDDPSVATDRPTYDDWNGVSGLGMVGDASFFPHMDTQWQSMVDEKSATLPSDVYTLRDQELCLVDGATKTCTIVENES